MAKGDSGAAQNQIDTQNKLAQGQLDTQNKIAQTGLTGYNNQLNQQYQTTQPQYQQALSDAAGEKSNIMGGYQNFMNNIGSKNALAGLNYGGGAGLSNQNEVNSALGGYQNFADTGGFSKQNIGAMQQASMAPIRGAYQQAQNSLQQGQGLAGGYSPNMAAAQSQMARQQGQQMSQAEIGSQANIANLVQQGKLAGLGGLSQTALQNQAEGLQAAAINNQYNLGLGGLNLQQQQMQGQQMLGGLQGQAGLYSATPGTANMLQNYLTNVQQMQGNAAGLQNQLSLGTTNAQNQLSLGTMNAQIAKGQIPGNFQQGISNVSNLAGLIGKLGQGLGGLSGGGNNSPASFVPGAGLGGDQGPPTPPGYQYPPDPNNPTYNSDDPNNPWYVDPNDPSNYPGGTYPGGPGNNTGTDDGGWDGSVGGDEGD